MPITGAADLDWRVGVFEGGCSFHRGAQLAKESKGLVRLAQHHGLLRLKSRRITYMPGSTPGVHHWILMVPSHLDIIAVNDSCFECSWGLFEPFNLFGVQHVQIQTCTWSAHLGSADPHTVEAMGFRNLSVDCACVCLSLPALLPKIRPLASGRAAMILGTMPLFMVLLPSLVLGPVPGDGLGLLGGRDLLVKTSPSRGPPVPASFLSSSQDY